MKPKEVRQQTIADLERSWEALQELLPKDLPEFRVRDMDDAVKKMLAMAQESYLKENHKAQSIVIPEYTLPGGLSRFLKDKTTYADFFNGLLGLVVFMAFCLYIVFIAFYPLVVAAIIKFESENTQQAIRQSDGGTTATLTLETRVETQTP